MTDIVERLLDYAKDDHERGCQGRFYDCSCGYDDKRDPLLKEAALEIERLRAALKWFADAYNKAGFIAAAYVHEPECHCLRCAHDNARTALTQKDATDEW